MRNTAKIHANPIRREYTICVILSDITVSTNEYGSIRKNNDVNNDELPESKNL